MEPTIFSKIITGEIPSYKIYEDDKVFAFLDIYPVQPGHVLVVPKNPVEFVWDLPETDYTALMLAVQKIAQHLRSVTSKPFIASRVIGVDVPHAHVQLIPFTNAEELNKPQNKALEPDHVALAKIAQQLAF